MIIPSAESKYNNTGGQNVAGDRVSECTAASNYRHCRAGHLCETVRRAHRARPSRFGLYHPTHPP